MFAFSGQEKEIKRFYCNFFEAKKKKKGKRINDFNFAFRYEQNLENARITGVKKGFVNGITFGLIFFLMFSTYGLGFWYGSKLVFDDQIEVGDLLTSFFGVLIGSFTIGQVGSNSNCKKHIK